MYLYESHLGGFYESLDYLDPDELHCETCGDSDSYIGSFDTPEEKVRLLATVSWLSLDAIMYEIGEEVPESAIEKTDEAMKMDWYPVMRTKYGIDTKGFYEILKESEEESDEVLASK